MNDKLDLESIHNTYYRNMYNIPNYPDRNVNYNPEQHYNLVQKRRFHVEHLMNMITGHIDKSIGVVQAKHILTCTSSVRAASYMTNCFPVDFFHQNNIWHDEKMFTISTEQYRDWNLYGGGRHIATIFDTTNYEETFDIIFIASKDPERMVPFVYKQSHIWYDKSDQSSKFAHEFVNTATGWRFQIASPTTLTQRVSMPASPLPHPTEPGYWLDPTIDKLINQIGDSNDPYKIY